MAQQSKETVYTERISNEGWLPPWIRHQHVTRYEWILPRVAGLHVADAASGTGYGTAILATRAASVDGFDLSAQAVDEARRAHAAPNITFTEANVLEIPRPDATYDAFVSLETIEHLPDTGAYLREIRRVLKPGGTFYCSTPNRLVTNPGTSKSDPPYNPWHLFEFTPDELAEALGSVFSEVTMLGQRYFARSYVKTLGGIGRIAPQIAVRLHQLRKVTSIPVDRVEDHMPRPQPDDGAAISESLFAYCR